MRISHPQDLSHPVDRYPHPVSICPQVLYTWVVRVGRWSFNSFSSFLVKQIDLRGNTENTLEYPVYFYGCREVVYVFFYRTQR